MPRKKANIHYLYKTTCITTGRYYIGIHSTSNIDDGYMGSGKRLRYSIRKHGKDSHIKEIIEFFDSRGLLIEAEKQMITSEMLIDNMCMNIMSGGTGGLYSIEHVTNNGYITSKMNKERMKIDSEFKAKVIETLRQNVINAHKNGKYSYDKFKGKKHSNEAKRKIGATNSIKQQGKFNSQFGTCWITNNVTNKKISISEISEYTNNGWVKGRKLN